MKQGIIHAGIVLRDRGILGGRNKAVQEKKNGKVSHWWRRAFKHRVRGLERLYNGQNQMEMSCSCVTGEMSQWMMEQRKECLESDDFFS